MGYYLLKLQRRWPKHSPFVSKEHCSALKWIWQISNPDANSLWKIYCVQNAGILSWHSMTDNRNQFSQIWRGIIKACILDENAWNFFTSNVKAQVNNGMATRFWIDHWCGDFPLKDRFPRLFSLAVDEKISVANARSSILATNCRPAWFPLRLSEQEDLTDLANMLPALPLTQDSDLFIWKIGKNNSYTVCSFTKGLSNRLHPHRDTLFTTCWKSICSPKNKFFGWIMLHNRLPCKEFLAHLHIIPSDQTTCPFCQSPESQNHIFMFCKNTVTVGILCSNG